MNNMTEEQYDHKKEEMKRKIKEKNNKLQFINELRAKGYDEISSFLSYPHKNAKTDNDKVAFSIDLEPSEEFLKSMQSRTIVIGLNPAERKNGNSFCNFRSFHDTKWPVNDIKLMNKTVKNKNMQNAFIYDVMIKVKKSRSRFINKVVPYYKQENRCIGIKNFTYRLYKLQKEDFLLALDNELFDIKGEEVKNVDNNDFHEINKRNHNTELSEEEKKEKFIEDLIEHLCTTDINAFYSITRYLKPKRIICLGKATEEIVKLFQKRINEIEGEQSEIRETKIIFESHPAADSYRNKRS